MFGTIDIPTAKESIRHKYLTLQKMKESQKQYEQNKEDVNLNTSEEKANLPYAIQDNESIGISKSSLEKEEHVSKPSENVQEEMIDPHKSSRLHSIKIPTRTSENKVNERQKERYRDKRRIEG